MRKCLTKFLPVIALKGEFNETLNNKFSTLLIKIKLNKDSVEIKKTTSLIILLSIILKISKSNKLILSIEFIKML